MKRLGFLLEALNIETDIIEKLLKLITASYVVLDTELPAYGNRSSRWQILINLDVETIKSAIYS